jgi:hypothetical protein
VSVKTAEPAHQRIEISFTSPLRIIKDEPETHPGSRLTISYDGFTVTAEGNHVMYTLPVDKLVSMQVSYVDAQGNPATIDGEVSWASSDAGILAVKVDTEDSSIVTVTPVGAVGQTQVTATADADLGAGVRNLITVCDIEVVSGEAVAGTIAPLGEAEPIAPHVEPVTGR